MSDDSEIVDFIADVIHDNSGGGATPRSLAVAIVQACNKRNDALAAEMEEWTKSDDGVQTMRASFAADRRVSRIGQYVLDHEPMGGSATPYREAAIKAGDQS